MSNPRRWILQANEEYAASFGDSGQGWRCRQRGGFAMLTCMDARLDPAKYPRPG
jgi:carbonic anhydrase